MINNINEISNEDNSNSSSEEKLQSLLKTEEKEKEILKNCVTIKNIKKNIGQQDLISHFISCGKIKNIIIDRKYNIAHIEFESEKSVKLAMKFTKTIIKKCKIGVFKKKNIKLINK